MEKNELYILVLIILAVVFLSVGIVMSSGLLGKPVKNNSSMTVNKSNSSDVVDSGSPQKNLSDKGDTDLSEDSYDYDYDYYDYYDYGYPDYDSGGEDSYPSSSAYSII